MDATFQISRFSSEFSFNTRRYLQHLQRPASSNLTSDTSVVSDRGNERVASRDRGSLRMARIAIACGWRFNVTMPLREVDLTLASRCEVLAARQPWSS